MVRNRLFTLHVREQKADRSGHVSRPSKTNTKKTSSIFTLIFSKKDLKKKTTKIAPERGSSVQDKAQEAWRAVE
jgi:hypothetical protein